MPERESEERGESLSLSFGMGGYVLVRASVCVCNTYVTLVAVLSYLMLNP